jgi:hypothetical protein
MIPGFFGQRDEGRRRDQAGFGVLPAHQRLQPAHPAVLQIDLRLIVQQELTAFERAVQTGFEPHAFDGLSGELA